MGKKTLLITGAVSAALAVAAATAAVAVAPPPDGDDPQLDGTARQRASDAAIAHTGPGTAVSVEPDNDPGTAYEVEVQLDNGNRVEVSLDGSFSVVRSEAEGQDDGGSAVPLSAADRDRAGQAALAAVGRGRVGDVERDNEGGSAYEVEVILDDGSEVDVELGPDFTVLRTGAPERD